MASLDPPADQFTEHPIPRPMRIWHRANGEAGGEGRRAAWRRRCRETGLQKIGFGSDHRMFGLQCLGSPRLPRPFKKWLNWLL